MVSKWVRKRISHKHLRSNRRSVRYKQINLEYLLCESDHAGTGSRQMQRQAQRGKFSSMFQPITKIIGQTKINLFASRQL